MVLQNESIDDELEHFEDVIKETDNEPSTVPKKQADNITMDINNHLLGKEILSLAEEDVPPEDLIFHKFYTNKMSSKPKKNKKKSADEEDADFFDDDEEVEEEDDDLIGATDINEDIPSDMSGGEAEDAIDVDDDDNDDKRKLKQKQKRKSEKASPFASYKEYVHLMKDDGDESHRTQEKPARKKHESKKSKKNTKID
nr:phosphopantothenoylcysteine decarboxylase subunit VHS3-like [Arachis hypogaea]